MMFGRWGGRGKGCEGEEEKGIFSQDDDWQGANCLFERIDNRKKKKIQRKKTKKNTLSLCSSEQSSSNLTVQR